MNDRRTQVILSVFCTILIIFSFCIGSRLPADIAALLQSPVIMEDSTAASRLSLITSAAGISFDRSHFIYTGGFESPFRKQGASPHTLPGGKLSEKSSRIRLVLKGILSKDRPIAILEDPSGETFIRGIGEKAGNQTVVSIKGNLVTLRDHLGTYDVIVEEK